MNVHYLPGKLSSTCCTGNRRTQVIPTRNYPSCCCCCSCCWLMLVI